MDACSSHAFICKRAPNQIARHQALNDVVEKEFVSASVPVTSRVDKARWQATRWSDTDSWQRGRPLTWDVTTACTLSGPYVSIAVHSGSAAAAQVACRKAAKYHLLAQTGRLFQPIVVETLSPLNKSLIVFFSKLGRQIALVS